MLELVLLVMALFLFEPAYYQLKSKGRAASRYVWLTILVTACAQGLAYIYPDYVHVSQWSAWWFVFPIASFAFPVALLILSRWLPPVSGAPGQAYLTVKTVCPHCHQTVSFNRKKQGNASLCPSCKELMEVPHEEGEDRPMQPAFDDSRLGSGRWRTIFRNLNPTVVELACLRLRAEGVNAYVADSLIANADPAVSWAGGGARLMVDESSVEDAREILTQSEHRFALPHDFVPPPLEEEDSPGDQTGLMLIQVAGLLLVLPSILAWLWGWIDAIIYMNDSLRGMNLEAYRDDVTFRICLVLAILRVAATLRAGREVST